MKMYETKLYNNGFITCGYLYALGGRNARTFAVNFARGCYFGWRFVYAFEG